MGAYLSAPVTDKISSDNNLEWISYGASSMQGWRVSQEDAHNCSPHYHPEKKACLFAVYDGHGGAEVAQYCSLHLPDFIKNSKSYKDGNFAQALEETFLEFDATLTTQEVIAELKTLAGTHEDEDEEDEEEAAMLVEEADMPLEELMERYGAGEAPPNVANLKKEKSFQSPVVRAKKSKPVSGLAANSEHNSIDADNDVATSEDLKQNLANKLLNGHSEGESNGNIKTESVTTKAEGDENTVKEAPDSTQDSMEEERTLKKDSKDEKDNEDSCVSSSVDGAGDKASVKAEGPSGSAPSGSDEAQSSGAGSSSAVGSSSAAGGSSSSSSAGGSGSSSIQDSEAGSSTGSSKLLDGVEDEDDDDDPEDATFVEGQEEDSSDGDDDEEDEDDDGELDDEDDDEDEQDGGEVDYGGDTEEPGSDSGCTAVVSLMVGRELYVANAGDSRCVLSRAGKAIDMSVDHKPEDDIEQTRIKKAGGKVTPDGRVNGGLNLSRAIGDHCYKKNKDLPLKDQMISALPDIKSVTLQEDDDFMVIACDGIWNFMTSQEVVDFIGERLKKENVKKNLSVICEELFDHCLAPNTMGDGTGCDNMTCVIVTFNKLHDVQGSKRKAEEETEETADEAAKKARQETVEADGDK